MKNLIILFALTFASFSANAAKVYIEQIDYYESDAGEPLDEFVSRFSPLAAWHGMKHTAEVCGSIESTEDGRYSMILGTSSSQLFCNIPSLWLSRPIGVIFHTHPKRGRDGTMHLTRTSRGLMATEQATVRLGHGFSDADYEAGTGYLVEGCDLLFQSGRGTERVVANICQ